MPVSTATVTIEAVSESRTRMSIASVFPDVQSLEQVLAMGMEEGLTQAIGQIDDILAEDSVEND